MKLGRKLRDMSGGQVGFKCPGCDEYHVVTVDPDYRAATGPFWGYNGIPDAPTFTPSVLVRSGHYATGGAPGNCWCDFAERFPDQPADRYKCTICHSYVTDGRIQFLPDSTHALAGQTVDLPDIRDEED